MMNTTQWKGVNSGPGASPNIWADCPWTLIDQDPNVGFKIYDNFLTIGKTPPTTEGNFGRYKGFTSSGGIIGPSGEYGGGIRIYDATDNEAASLGTSNFPFKIGRGMGKFWFEASVKVSAITDTTQNLFIGLFEDAALSATVPFGATGVITDNNYVGFQRLEADGDKLDIVYRANGVTAVTVLADAVTLVADTYVKIGMVFDPSTNVLTFFADGVPVATKTIPSSAGDDFPNDVQLGLVFAAMNAATATVIPTMRWWRAAQLHV